MRNQAVLAITVNFYIVVKLVYEVWIGNDKALILLMLFYPILLLINLTVWIILRKMRRPKAFIYKTAVYILLLLFLPTIFLAALF